ncbi:hypothetical protein R1sor_026988 [Riccia sorocarpa]|uniref:Uncharacterized protein n=1 Tax=Riccia sorocarpa TaxID=122646 RepID=A0ABD3GD02_9MARC
MADDNEPLVKSGDLTRNLPSVPSSSKRKRGGGGEVLVGGDGEDGGESGSGAETSLEIRSKRRNGVGGRTGDVDAAIGGKVGGAVSSVEGSETTTTKRKRKSLDRVAAAAALASASVGVPEDDAGSLSPSREALRNGSSSSKKRKPGGGGFSDDPAAGMDAEPNDEGRASQGLRLRFTRSGNSLAAKKVVPLAEEEKRTGEGSEHVEGAASRIRSTNQAANRSGEEAWAMPSQARDQSHALTGEPDDTLPNSNSGKIPEKPSLTREIYRIPAYAGWFNWSKIHNIEKRSVLEFFDGKSLSKTPKIYKEYRDFIINKYRENPQRTLTFTEVRRMLIGDVNAIRRVFDFLDHWGLINYHSASETNQEPSPSVTIDDGIPNGVRVALGPVVTHITGNNPYLQRSDSTNASGVQIQNLSSYKNAFEQLSSAGEAERIATKVNCSSCGGDCSKVRFHCQEEVQAGLDLCTACFRAGKYGAGLAAQSFVRMEGETHPGGDQWSTKETLSLLEAIARFGDNWNQVADYVGTKAKAECVKQFVRLPFGDRFLLDQGAEPASLQDRNMLVDDEREAKTSDKAHEADESRKSNGEKHSESADGVASKAHKPERLLATKEFSPFQDLNNPLLSQVALMSAMVGPRVAAAAAEAAITTIAEVEPALANHPIANGFSPLPGAQQYLDSRSRELTMSEAKEEQSPVEHVDGESGGAPSAVQLQVGIATSLAAAAVNARLLADQEEREMELLMTDIIENQLKALYAKLEHFEELELLLEKERLQVEQARQTLFAHQILSAESRLRLSRHG